MTPTPAPRTAGARAPGPLAAFAAAWGAQRKQKQKQKQQEEEEEEEEEEDRQVFVGVSGNMPACCAWHWPPHTGNCGGDSDNRGVTTPEKEEEGEEQAGVSLFVPTVFLWATALETGEGEEEENEKYTESLFAPEVLPLGLRR